MSPSIRVLSLCLPLTLCFACVEDDGGAADDLGVGSESGDGDNGDGDPGDGDPGDGDTDEPPGCDGTSPYQGGWEIGCCQGEVAPTPWNPGGIGQGSVLPDWTFTDQFGDSVRVWDFCHNAIYFEYVAFW